MKTARGFAVALGMLACAGVAQAGKENPDKLFGGGLDRDIDPKLRVAIDRVVEDCSYSMFSRIGPRPEQVTKCNRAEEKVVAFGAPAARAAMARLETEIVDGARGRLYDVVGRTGDETVLEALIGGLARADKHEGGFMRQMDKHSLENALRRITSAEVGERAPWVSGQHRPDADAWRAWLEAHRGMSRDQLLAERVTRARATTATAELTGAFLSSQFLSQQPVTRDEGLAGLQALLRRPGLSATERRNIEYAIGRTPKAPHVPQQAVAKGEPRV